jgi:MFS family permease
MAETAKTGPRSLRWYEGLRRYHWLVLIVASCGWLFDTMDQWIFNLLKQPAVAALLGVPSGDPLVKQYSAAATAIFIVGWASGGLLFGMVGDRLGRTRTMVITVLIYAIFTGLSGLSQTYWQFVLLRFLTGLGIGGEFAAGAALIAEVFPEHARTTALGVMQASSALGNLMAGLLSYLIASSSLPMASAWRWVFAAGAFPALLVVVIRAFIKEPERWQHAKENALAGQRGLGSIPELFRDPVLRGRSIVCVALAAVGVVGFWGIATWSPELARQALNPTGAEELKRWAEQQMSLAVMAQQAGAFFGILVWTALAKKLGRRPAFLLTFVACAVAVPATFHLTHSFATALVMFPLMGFTTTALFGGYAVYFPELYPTRLRATGTGFCYNVARYISAGGPWIFGSLAAMHGIRWAATMVASVYLLGLIALPFAPETKGKPLPED